MPKKIKIIVIVVLALLISTGGLFAWRTYQATQQEIALLRQDQDRLEFKQRVQRKYLLEERDKARKRHRDQEKGVESLDYLNH